MTHTKDEALKLAIKKAHMLVQPVPAKEVTTLELAKAVSEQAVELCLILEEVLAQPAPTVQEPVAWRYTDARGHYRYRGYVPNFDVDYKLLKPQPLYTTPPAAPAAQRKPLTDDEIWREYRFLWPFHPAEERMLASDILMFARAIEAKLKEKNT